MNLVLIMLLAYVYAPADSSWRLVDLFEVPERAVLFAELAARDGGRSVIDLGSMLELSGRFQEASSVYGMALNSASDSLLEDWLRSRIRGCTPLDTLIVLRTVVTNSGGAAAEDIRIMIPLPVSHPPYQRIDETGGVFVRGSGFMEAVVGELPAGSSTVLPLILHVRQQPHTYRPLPRGGEDPFGEPGLRGIAGIMRSISVPESLNGPGPCLELAMALRDSAQGFEPGLTVTGGLLVTGGDSLVFHAWNTLTGGSLPMDVSLFQSDSLRGIAHCPSDMIPLWDLDRTEGHEVSAYYVQPGADLQVGMTASFADPIFFETLLDIFPLCFLAAPKQPVEEEQHAR